MITLTAYLSDGTTKDLTANTGNYSLSDHIDQLSAELKFDLTANPLDANFKDLWVPVGTKISFTHDKINLFQGIITKYDRNSLANFEMYPLYWTPSKEGTFCVIRLNLS